MGLLEDARNIQRKDPAARNVLEVILLYPGFHILVYHRIAHWLYQHKRFFLARWVSQHGRHKTGIEIHPGAKIGKCLEVLVEERDEDGSYVGRTVYDAPEIDNAVLFTSKRDLRAGDFVQVQINDAFDYDLIGVEV